MRINEFLRPHLRRPTACPFALPVRNASMFLPRLTEPIEQDPTPTVAGEQFHFRLAGRAGPAAGHAPAVRSVQVTAFVAITHDGRSLTDALRGSTWGTTLSAAKPGSIRQGSARRRGVRANAWSLSTRGSAVSISGGVRRAMPTSAAGALSVLRRRLRTEPACAANRVKASMVRGQPERGGVVRFGRGCKQPRASG